MYWLPALFLFAQGAPVGVPFWLAIVSPLITGLATVAVAWVTLTRTSRREEEALWRVERKQAYVTFLALGRAAKAATDPSSTEGTTKEQEEKKEKILEDLRDTHATVAMVGRTDALFAAAQAYYDICKYKLQDGDLSELKINDYSKARDSFFENARDELGLPSYFRL